jgi:hypothetical protein
MGIIAGLAGLGVGGALAAGSVGAATALGVSGTALLGGSLAAGVASQAMAAKKGSAAARAAANAQKKGQDAAIAEQQRQFDTMREILAPYVTAGRPDLTQEYIGAGTGAIQQMQRLAGLGGEQARQQALFKARQTPQFTQLSQITQSNVDEYLRNREQELALFKKSAAYKKPTLAEGQKGKTAIKQAQEDLIAQFKLETDKGIRGIETQGFEQEQAILNPILQDQQYDQIGRQQQQQAIQQIEQGPLFQELARQGEAGLLATASATGRRGAEDTQAMLGKLRPQLLNSLIEQQYAKFAGLANVGQTAAQNLLNIGQASAAGTANMGIQSGGAISNLLGQQGATQAAGITGAANAQIAGGTGAAGALSGGLQNFALLNMLGTGGNPGLGEGGFYKSRADALAAGGGAPVAYSPPTTPGGYSGFYFQS